MQKKFYLIIIIGITLTAVGAISRSLIRKQANPIMKPTIEDQKEEKAVLSKDAKEYLALAEKFMNCKNLSFKFDYTLYAGEDLNEIAEHIEGSICKADTFYKMITEDSELVVDSFVSVSVDHISKKIMVTWSLCMDRRYSMLLDIKEMAEFSSLVETVTDQGKTQKAYKTYKISTKGNKGYVLIDLDTVSGFPKRIEVMKKADGIENFDDTRLVISYNQMHDKPIPASEFSYNKYIEIEPELRVKKQFSTYELLTNL